MAKTIPSQQKVGKTIVVDRCNLTPDDGIEYPRLVDIDGRQGTEPAVVVA
jgi:hypothetical protein